MFKTSYQNGVIAIKGKMTVENASGLMTALLGEALSGQQDIALDLSGVDEMDSSGVQILALLRREALASGMKFSVVSHSETSRDLILLYRLEPELGEPDII